MNKNHILSSIFLMCLCLALHGQAPYEYEVSTLIPQGSNQLDDGLCLNDQGILYASLYGNWPGSAGSHILRYHPDGSRDTLIAGLTRPNGISFHNGYIYAANSEAGQVWKISRSGQHSVLTALSGVSNVIPVPGTDSLIAVSWSRNTVFGINAQGNVTNISQSSLFNGLAGAAYDSAGVLYVANYNDGKILRHEGGSTFSLFQDLKGGIGFIAYADGAIWATNHGDKKIYRTPVSGGPAEVIAGNGQAKMLDGMGTMASFLFPNGITATPSGDTLYISEYTAKSLRMIVRRSITSSGQRLPAAPSIYPIPNAGTLHFEHIRPADIGGIKIHNTAGKLVLTTNQPFMGMNNTWEIPTLSQGTYLLTIFDQQMRPIAKQLLPLVK